MEKITHFSHIHPLRIKEEQKNVVCSGCGKPISGAVCFCCDQCNYVLHKSCAELPRQIKHPLHHLHPLTLLSTPPYSSDIFICNACGDFYDKKFVYHCSLCQFDLDVQCASLRHPDDGHRHAFISSKNPQSFVCYACGGHETSESFHSQCTICQIWVHSSCAELPQTIRINSHYHSLKLTYSLHQVYGFRDDITCGACHGTMSATFAAYFCSTCKYQVHLKCPDHQPWETANEDDESDVGSEVCHPLDIGFSFFCHDHLLTFMEELSPEYADKLCDGCIQPITLPFYSCEEQDCCFLLHQSCAELPRTKHHRFHPHPLTLLSKAPPYDGIYRCDGCKTLSNGFVYRCDKCQFDLDVCCGSLPETVKHESHEHPLILEKASIARQCKNCQLWSKHVFACNICEDFAIDCGCATLPSKALHMYDKHPLSLTYFVKGDELKDYYECGICKEKRFPKQWFYYCDDCDFGAHPYCVVGKPRRVKFGGTFQYAHSHPLALVEETRQNVQCEACGEGCNGWTLECGQCKYYFHRQGKCFWEQFKRSAKYMEFSGTMRHRYAANVLATTLNETTKWEPHNRK